MWIGINRKNKYRNFRQSKFHKSRKCVALSKWKRLNKWEWTGCGKKLRYVCEREAEECRNEGEEMPEMKVEPNEVELIEREELETEEIEVPEPKEVELPETKEEVLEDLIVIESFEMILP